MAAAKQEPSELMVVFYVLKHTFYWDQFGNTKKTFPPHYYQVFGGIMLVRDEHLSRAQEIAYNRDHSQRGDERNGYYRFVPYEFSLKHPKWFLGILRENRWAVLDAMFDSIKNRGGTVELFRSATKTPLAESFRFRVTHPADHSGNRTVEYVDTTYGASFIEVVDLLSRKSHIEQAQHTVYVPDHREIEVYKWVTQKERSEGIVFRVIDWPGGK